MCQGSGPKKTKTNKHRKSQEYRDGHSSKLDSFSHSNHSGYHRPPPTHERPDDKALCDPRANFLKGMEGLSDHHAFVTAESDTNGKPVSISLWALPSEAPPGTRSPDASQPTPSLCPRRSQVLGLVQEMMGQISMSATTCSVSSFFCCFLFSRAYHGLQGKWGLSS